MGEILGPQAKRPIAMIYQMGSKWAFYGSP
jgi:hypothetical protein